MLAQAQPEPATEQHNLQGAFPPGLDSCQPRIVGQEREWLQADTVDRVRSLSRVGTRRVAIQAQSAVSSEPVIGRP